MVTDAAPSWGFRARLIEVHDGDSIFIECDLGFYARIQVEIRLDGVHAPELTQTGGIESREYVKGWLTAHSASDRTWPLWVEIVATTTFEPGMRMSFVRYVGTVWAFDQQNQHGLDLNAAANAFLAEHPDWPGGR